jgi:TRAP-type mannitol/chloroaromatic compound transport system permease small subunit
MVTSAEAAAAKPLPLLRNFVALCGKGAAWLSVVMVLLTFVIVILRYGFNLGWIWLQESLTYLHVTVFAVVTAWALQDDAHVRVDIFYTRMNPGRRALVDFIGTLLFLVPFCIFILVTAWPYVAASWKLLEGSREAGGLPLVYLLKSLIIVMPALLLAQSMVILADTWRILRHGGEPPA